MAGRQQGRLRLFLIRLDGEDRIVPNQDDRGVLQGFRTYRARSSADEDRSEGRAPDGTSGERHDVGVATSDQSFT